MPFPVAGPAAPVAGGLVPGSSAGYWTGALTFGADTVNFGIVDDDGTAWIWCGVDGWDGPGTAGQVVQRAGDHGGWSSPQYFAPRVLTLRISVSAPSQTLRDAARALVQKVVPVSDLATLRFDEPTPKQISVRRSGMLAESCVNLVSCDFAIGLVAPDPRKYATVARIASAYAPNTTSLTGITPPLTPPLALPAQPPAGEVTVANDGNIDTRPTITITGVNTGPSITNITTGQVISWPTVSLAAGDVLAVDLDARRATVNGAFAPAAVTSSWWTVPPGGATVQLGGTSDGTSLMTVTSRDAYL